MVAIGYSLMTEQRAPTELVADAVLAENAGFDFSTISDHFHPWVEAQGHSPYMWSMLGAISQVTKTLPLLPYVTAPIIRYHPAVVAQKAATMALLAPGRFRLGLGSGENLNEHVVGQGFPGTDVRQAMMEEAIEIMRELWKGDYVTFRGDYYDVERARLFDLPEEEIPIGVAAGGPQAAELAAKAGEFLISTSPDAELIEAFNKAGGKGQAVVGQMSVCWGPDEQLPASWHTSSTPGALAAGRSNPNSWDRTASRSLPIWRPRRWWPSRFPAVPTWTRSSMLSNLMSMPASPRWRLPRSVPTKRDSARSSQQSYDRNCATSSASARGGLTAASYHHN